MSQRGLADGQGSRAKSELGWEARTPLAEGLRRTIEWYEGEAAV